jgi:tRNA modification GTPase
MNAGPPRAVVLTARGRGAVAVIAVRGPGALGAVAAVLHGGTDLRATPGRPLLRRLGGAAGEEVVIVAEPAGAAVEVHCHGGTAVVAWVLDRLREAGVAVEQEAGAADRITGGTRGQAWALLPEAPTVRTAEILLEQATGALDAELSAIGGLVASDAQAAARRLRLLIERSRLGCRLISGHAVVLAGPPNVGKSSLFNAIAGYERAIVSPTAGTTRDALRARLAFRGWPVELVDTAGLHDAEHELDREAVARSRAALDGADLVLRVADRSRPFDAADFPDPVPAGRTLIVASKADLPAAWDADARGAVAVSAANGAGIAELIDAVLDRLGVGPEGPGGPLPFLPSQGGDLRRALAALEGGDAGAARRLLEGPAGAGPSGLPPVDRVS